MVVTILKKIPSLLEPILDGYDVSKGSRLLTEEVRQILHHLEGLKCIFVGNGELMFGEITDLMLWIPSIQKGGPGKNTL
jgi:hypothetical protein